MASSPRDPDQATVNAFFDTVDRYLWPCAISFVAGCYFTTGVALVWTWFQ